MAAFLRLITSNSRERSAWTAALGVDGLRRIHARGYRSTGSHRETNITIGSSPDADHRVFSRRP